MCQKWHQRDYRNQDRLRRNCFREFQKIAANESDLEANVLGLAKQVPEGNKDGGKLIANPNKTWKDVDPSLPNTKIEVLGPPPTSGTRDAFNELAIEGGCKTFPSLKAMKKQDKKKYKALCRGIREDGAYIEAGENDNLIVQKLEANPNAFGVFGYSFLDQNADKIQGSLVNGVAPEFENIAEKNTRSRARCTSTPRKHTSAKSRA